MMYSLKSIVATSFRVMKREEEGEEEEEEQSDLWVIKLKYSYSYCIMKNNAMRRIMHQRQHLICISQIVQLKGFFWISNPSINPVLM